MTGTPTTWQGWVDYYRPKWDAQTKAMLHGKGSDRLGVPQGSGPRDIEGHPRPRAGRTLDLTSIRVLGRGRRSHAVPLAAARARTSGRARAPWARDWYVATTGNDTAAG